MQLNKKRIGYLFLGIIAILVGTDIAFFGPVYNRGFPVSPFAGILIIAIGAYYIALIFILKK
jgi:uncharacterized membrane protein HdeD (DUF308 family)